jgi:hypothetical protein
MRLARGWSSDEALGIVTRARAPKRRVVNCAGRVFRSWAALAREYKVRYQLVAKRIRYGWRPEEAVGICEPPPRFRNHVGAARTRHWKRVQIVGATEFPSTEPGGFRVYVIRNAQNGREYVGITISPLDLRLRNHRANARKGVKGKLYNAMRHHGLEHFTIHLARNDARNFAQLQKQEIQEIRRRGTLKSGYNTSPGGSIGTAKPVRIGSRQFASRGQAASHFGIDQTVFNTRIRRLGWTPEQAAGIGVRRKYARRVLEIDGTKFRSLKAAAEHCGLDYKLVHDRVVAKGWSVEQALERAAKPATIKYIGLAVTAFGRSFRSLTSCAKAHGVKPESLWARVTKHGQDVENAILHLHKRQDRAAIS